MERWVTQQKSRAISAKLNSAINQRFWQQVFNGQVRQLCGEEQPLEGQPLATNFYLRSKVSERAFCTSQIVDWSVS